jgi:hypothetical protein
MSIDGAKSVDVTSISATGVGCSYASSSYLPISNVETIEDATSTNNGIFHNLLWPLLFLALLMLGLVFFIKRRRNRYLRSLDDIEERVATYIEDLRPQPMSAIDVHTCTSASCLSCVYGKKQTTFIPTNGPNFVPQNYGGQMGDQMGNEMCILENEI